MNILNQAVIPMGQPPALPFKGSALQEASQHIPVSLPNRNLSAIATGDSSRRAPPFGVPVSSFETDPYTIYFSRSLVQNDKPNLSEDGIAHIDDSATKLNDVLVVAVSSATKLDSKQIELITRKMQKLTGSRNLKLENAIDPSLIAGFVISYDADEPQVIDLSVKGQLDALAARAESSDRRNASHGQC